MSFRLRTPRARWPSKIESYQPPTLPSLGKEIINIHGLTTESRIAVDGLVYNCPNIAYFGGDIDVVLVRPKIRMPDEMELLGSYFGGIGASVAYSDKGNYFMDTLQRFGGLEETGAFIRTPATRGVLDKFMAERNAEDGSVIFLTNDQRSYLNFSAVRASMRGEAEAAALVDKLVGQHILQRGYILQCERCRLSSWYSLEVLTSDFTCSRCSFRQQFTLAHWRQPVEPHWYYRLAETVYQFYRHNSHVTVQALYKLKSRAQVAFHFVPEINLVGFPRAGEQREIDIACVVDGRIILGECKTEPLRPRDASKFEDLISRVRKRPSSIVFATNLDTVSDEFGARIRGLPKAEVLTFRDLYDV